jgi:uncharacterized membrane protein YfcA
LSEAQFAALLVAAVVGGAVQSVLGFGAAFVTIPAIALVAPELLPGASLFAMLPLVSTMAWRGRAVADRRSAGRMLVGRVPGVVVGSALVVAFSTQALTVFVAVILLTAVLSMSRGWSIEVTPRNQALAGFTSGITGTSTGLGGPPLALLYRSQAGPAMRATLSWLFFAGILLSLTTLTVLGEIASRHAQIGLPMGLAAAVGVLLASPLAGRLEPRHLRQGVLLWASAGAVVAAFRALTA